MKEFFEGIISGIGFNDVLDILITAFIIYKLLGFIRETRAQQLVKGLAIVVAAYFISGFLELHVISWILRRGFTLGLFALIVLFQPELRRALERIGRRWFGTRFSSDVDKDEAKRVIDEILNSVTDFSETRTGALLVFERLTPLEDIAETGTHVDAEVTAKLLENIFYKGSPLHDGATIIRGARVRAAGCVLPLSQSAEIGSVGTRHRAGLGVSEWSDALVIIVSEETGIISIAEDGKLRRYLDRKEVEKQLLNLYIDEEQNSGLLRVIERKLKEKILGRKEGA